MTAGKSIPLMRGHAHLTAFMGKQDYNFSHRIDKFSFGDTRGGGIVQPLEGDENIADDSKCKMESYCFLNITFNQFRTSEDLQYIGILIFDCACSFEIVSKAWYRAFSWVPIRL